MHRRRAAAHVVLDQQRHGGIVIETRAVDLQVFQHALDIVAGLREGDALDPVDRVDIGIARIAVILDPAAGAVGAGIIGGQRENVGAVELVHHLGQMMHAQREIIVQIVGQPVEPVGRADRACRRAGGGRHHLHHAARAGTGNGMLAEFGFLADHRMDQRVLGPQRGDLGQGDGGIGALRQDDAAQAGRFGGAHRLAHVEIIAGQAGQQHRLGRIGQLVVQPVGEEAEIIFLVLFGQKTHGPYQRAGLEGDTRGLVRLRLVCQLHDRAAVFARQLGEGQLSVIGGGMRAGLGIIAGGLVRASQRVGGARHPVGSARQRDRRRHIVPQAGEMGEGVFRPVQMHQGQPAGHEFGIGKIGTRGQAMGAGQRIGRLEIAIPDQVEDHQLALGPHQFQRIDVGMSVRQLQQ